MTDFRDKIFVVTGGTSGLGLATTRALLASGARVVALYREDRAKAGQLVRWAGERYEQSLEVIQLNVADRAACQRLAEQIEERHRSSLNGLVNNAATITWGDILSVTEAEMVATLQNNVIGLINVTQALWPLLTTTSPSSIVNISSSASRTGNPAEVIYAASKGAVEAVTRALARGGAEHGLSVNAVAPHIIESGMGHEALHRDPTMLARIPFNRTCDLSEYVSLVIFLLSGASQYLTGQVIHLNGGRLMMG